MLNWWLPGCSRLSCYGLNTVGVLVDHEPDHPTLAVNASQLNGMKPLVDKRYLNPKSC